MGNITRKIEIDYAHVLKDHIGKCHNLHGHRATVELTVDGTLVTEGSSRGMVMDFSFMKQILMDKIDARLDHGFAIELSDPRVADLTAHQPKDKLLIMDVPPTAENLALWAWTELEPVLPAGVIMVKIRWYETPNGWADEYGHLI